MNRSLRQVNFKGIVDSYFFPGSLLLLAFSIPYSIRFFNLSLSLFGLFWIVKCSKDFKLNVQRLYNRWTLLLIITYLIFVLSLVYSENQLVGIQLLEKKIAILLFPVLFSITVIERKLIDGVLLAFVISCTLASTYSLFTTLQIYLPAHHSLGDFFSAFDREVFCSTIDLFPTYYGIYVVFSFLALAYLTDKYWASIYLLFKFLFLLSAILLVLANILISARMPQVILVLVILVIYVRFLLRYKVAGLVILMFTIVVISVSVSRYKDVGKRFVEIAQTEWSPPRGLYHNSTNLRIGILYCSYDLLKENWLMGLGVGSVQQRLNDCYKSKGYSEEMHLGNYNTHNEYLNVWLCTGIFGLFIFLLTILIPIRYAFKRNDLIYLAFLVLIVLSFATESVLERQKGIVFYSFFNSIFAFNLFYSKDENL